MKAEVIPDFFTQNLSVMSVYVHVRRMRLVLNDSECIHYFFSFSISLSVFLPVCITIFFCLFVGFQWGSSLLILFEAGNNSIWIKSNFLFFQTLLNYDFNSNLFSLTQKKYCWQPQHKVCWSPDIGLSRPRRHLPLAGCPTGSSLTKQSSNPR